ncbi:uncharacterized protein LOC126314413 [Schistocerca gregaria]|uniref:uncharacterized protein LOC126314413 n=1 Tax=Schistocerca gregaria TaxID=7010 RepID=UPI00211F0D0D|nr:uncharacterized protein LOC126314413 [Schistocerca gregaria]
MDHLIDQLALIQYPFSLEKESIMGCEWREAMAWLLQSFDPVVFEQLKSQKSETTDTDHLLNVSCFFGLCNSTDYELMKGSVPELRKVEHLNRLVELCHLNRKVRMQAFDIEQWRSRAARLMSHVLEDGNLTSKQLNLFSADVYVGHSKQKGLAEVPSESALNALLDTVHRELESLEARINEARDIEMHDQDDEMDIETKIEERKTSLASLFKTLQKLIGDFENMYTCNVEPWSDQGVQNLVGIGPESKRAYDLHLCLQNALDRFEHLKEAYGKVENGEVLQALESDVVSLEDYGMSCLNDQIGILEVACHRMTE